MHVISAGMYRSCSTWQFMVASALLERHVHCERLGYITFDSMIAMETGANADRRSWLITKAHEGNGIFRRCLRNGTTLAFYSFRDVRDVLFSLMHKFGHGFEHMLRCGMFHQLLRNDRFWRRQPGTLVQRYESITTAPVDAVLEIAGHLGLSLGPAEAADVAAEHSLERNMLRTSEVASRLKARGADLSDQQFAIANDRHSLLHWNHIRGRSAAGWQQLATRQQVRAIGRLFGNWLIDNGYERDDSWIEETCATIPVAAGREFRAADFAVGYTCCRLRMAAFEYPRLRVLGRKALELTHLSRIVLERYRSATRVAVDPPMQENLKFASLEIETSMSTASGRRRAA